MFSGRSKILHHVRSLSWTGGLRLFISALCVVIGVQSIIRIFSHESFISHCQPRLEAAGVHLHVEQGAEVPLENAARSLAYDSFQSSLQEQGLSLGVSVTQGLSVGDLFQVVNGQVMPRLTALDVPVRAIVAPVIDSVVAHRLSEAFENHIQSLTRPSAVWPQRQDIYHTTLWHASHHQAPVAATVEQVEQEVASLQAALGGLCPLQMVLERVVVNSAGIVMACWQQSHGPSVGSLREAIAAALPNAPAPEKQAVQNKALWYTTLGRIIEDPGTSWSRVWLPMGGSPAHMLSSAARRMTDELCGLQMRIDRVWFVQEHEKLALALGGRWDLEEVLLSEDC